VKQDDTPNNRKWYERFSVVDKYIVLTGASGGIGLAITRAFLEAGAHLIIVSRRTNIDWQGLDNEYCDKFHQHLCDLSNSDEVTKLAKVLQSNYSRIDVLINNACLNNVPSIDAYSISVFETIRKVGLDASYILCGKLAKHMAKNRSGCIINITSINAEAAWPNNPAYVTVKSGLRMFTKAIARDFGQFGVRANNLSPGYIHTAMTDKSFNDPVAYKERSEKTMLGRWGLPSEIADACLFLASDASSYITGADIHIDGGWLAKGL